MKSYIARFWPFGVICVFAWLLVWQVVGAQAASEMGSSNFSTWMFKHPKANVEADLSYWLVYSSAGALILLMGLWLGRNMAFKNSMLERNKWERLESLMQKLQIENEQLKENNDRLSTESKEKDQLVSLVAHDLKNPLGQVKGLVGILRSYNPSAAEQEEIMDRLTDTVERLEQLVSRTLNLQSIGNLNQEIYREVCDIKPIMAKVIRDFQPLAKEKNIRLQHFLHEAPIFCYLDKTHLLQVVENLLSNAIKFSPKGRKISLHLSRHEESCCLLRVTDEGPGFKEADKEKMFGKFQRLSARPTNGEHSTGLGLSIVKSLVEVMEGKVWVESQEGQGATFFVRFSCHIEEGVKSST